MSYIEDASEEHDGGGEEDAGAQEVSDDPLDLLVRPTPSFGSHALESPGEAVVYHLQRQPQDDDGEDDPERPRRRPSQQACARE